MNRVYSTRLDQPIDGGASMHLDNVIRQTQEYLGPGYFLRCCHPFLVPTPKGVIQRFADGVFFRTPIPSAKTAQYAFVDQANGELEEFGYLGAPFVFALNGTHIGLYEFGGSPLPELVASSDASETETVRWVRGRLDQLTEQGQLPLTFRVAREIFIGETKAALSEAVRNLMLEEIEDHHIDEAEAFHRAMKTVRQALFSSGTRASKPRGWLSFANVPPEAFAELYESLAVQAHARRRTGVVYTPSWLARFVVSRLPRAAFRDGLAADPTCGSGTFLVSFLEELVEAYPSTCPTDLNLSKRVLGTDVDPVAIETAKLSLDFFAQSIGLPPQRWQLHVADALSDEIDAHWLLGNLPFGYRTYKGRGDLSSALIEHIISTARSLRALALVLPESFSYTGTAEPARELLRTQYDLLEITRLPEATFETSSVRTLVLSAQPGIPRRDLLVREVERTHLPAFRSGLYVAKSFTMRLPREPSDPWRFSPFSNEFERAEKKGVALAKLADVRVGLQIYGTESTALATRGHRRLLIDPKMFARWSSSSVAQLPRLVANREAVRRAGPWERFPEPKVILRSTTAVRSVDRLAAVPDRRGIWFTDKFIGLWPKVEYPNVEALAAYLQTRFARAWFEVHNPSRKARVRVLSELPVPRLSEGWWKRAARLVEPNQISRPPRAGGLFDEDKNAEWRWFNESVEAALELQLGAGNALELWLTDGGQQQGNSQ